jgi:hypothetical protein
MELNYITFEPVCVEELRLLLERVILENNKPINLL